MSDPVSGQFNSIPGSHSSARATASPRGPADPVTVKLTDLQVEAGTGASSIPAVDRPPDSPASATNSREIVSGTVLCRRYLIERAIGTGGTSTVFSALDRHRLQGAGGDAMVAVKILLPAHRNDQTRIDRLIREFRYMQRLTHPGIARVFDLDCDEGVWFMTMELLQGESLSRYLRKHAPAGLGADEALRILIECSEALLCAHQHGVVHGDLKPGNVFIDTRGSAHLLDFGSVPDQTGNGVPLHEQFATPAYASPQMLEGSAAEVRDDLFSLGCLAYEIFSGQHPFNYKSSLSAREESLRLTWLRSIPARHFGVIARMLSWDRESRPASAREFVDSLSAAQVRAKAAFVREPRPLEPPPAAPEPAQTEPPQPETTHPSASPGELEQPAGGSRKPHRSAPTEEDIARAFAQFAGVVPANWVGPEKQAPAAEPTLAEQPNSELPQAELLQARWRKGIPPELFKSKASTSAFDPSSTFARAEHAGVSRDASSPDSISDAAVEQPATAPRTDPDELRQRSRRKGVVEPIATLTEPEVDNTPTTPVEEVTPAAAAPLPQLQLRTALPSTWGAIASRLRLWRPTSTVRLKTQALASATESAQSQSSGTPMHGPASWIPQLQLQQSMDASWPQLRLAHPVATVPTVRFDPLMLPEAPSMPIASVAVAAESEQSAESPVDQPADTARSPRLNVWARALRSAVDRETRQQALQWKAMASVSGPAPIPEESIVFVAEAHSAAQPNEISASVYEPPAPEESIAFVAEPLSALRPEEIAAFIAEPPLMAQIEETVASTADLSLTPQPQQPAAVPVAEPSSRAPEEIVALVAEQSSVPQSAPVAAPVVVSPSRAPRVPWHKALPLPSASQVLRWRAHVASRSTALWSAVRTGVRAVAVPKVPVRSTEAATVVAPVVVMPAFPQTQNALTVADPSSTSQPKTSAIPVTGPPPAPRVPWHKAAAPRFSKQLRQWHAASASRSSALWSRARSATGAVSLPQIPWRNALDVGPHWLQLRKSIRSLSSQPRPQWREAMPVLTIAGTALVALLLLQFSYDVRSDGSSEAERERMADVRLAALANAAIPLTMPDITPLAPAALPVVAVPPSVPAAPGRVSFQAKRVHVAAGQLIAAVNLRRANSTAGAAPVSWSIAAGTAKPGIDYELPKLQVARFNDGQDQRTLFIPIKQSNSPRERAFTIKLRKTPGAPALGPITEIEVVLAGSG